MSITLSVSDLINIAVAMERRGIIFYDVMAKSTEDEMARAVFQNLTEMERGHIIIFEEMLGNTGQHRAENLTDEDADYLQALVESAVFTDDAITGEMAAQADSDIRAMELGINAEKDSILFYSHLRAVMPKSSLPMLDRIITEERLHLRQLTEIKKRLAASTP